jgi:cell division protein FtsW
MRGARNTIFITVAVLVAIGVVMIYSASAIYADSVMNDSLYYIKRRLFYIAIGLVMMVLAMSLNLDKVRSAAKPIMLVSILLLAAVLIPHIGSQTAGARRWFKFGPLSFQPSELAKISIIIYMADFISRKEKVIKSFIHGYLPAIMVLGMTVALVLLEPDLGTAITVSAIAVVMLYAGGARSSYIMAVFLMSLPMLYVLLFRVAYRRKRMMIFLNPWSDRRGTGFQIIQSFVALGSGGLFGVGLGQSRQKLFYLPASHTDFIFSIIGEELGFIGTASIVVLFGILVWQGMKIAFKAIGTFERLTSLGIVSLIGIEAIINIGVTAGALPTKGLPLPFISYGGSGLVFHLMAIGILFNISRRCESCE